MKDGAGKPSALERNSALGPLVGVGVAVANWRSWLVGMSVWPPTALVWSSAKAHFGGFDICEDQTLVKMGSPPSKHR